MSLNKNELKQIEGAIIKLLREEVGPIIKSQSGKYLTETYDDKANQVDLVTKSDKNIEFIIKDKLKELYPTFHFVGEEEYIPGETEIPMEPTFVVDPIDGTTNFIHGFPYSCCSIGLAVDGKSVVGCVFNPHLDQLYHASKGNGAFVNDEPIRTAKRPLTLQKSVVGLEGGADRADSPGSNFDIKMSTYKNLLSDKGGFIHGFRSLGSAALNICYTATGIFDAYWEGGCWAWDVCAGWCILEESGGSMIGGNKGQWDIGIDHRVYFAIRGGCTPEEQHKFAEDFWNQTTGDLKY